MKHFFALPTLLRTATLLASASQHSFSVQDDLLAFPQYEVMYVDDWTREDQAQAKISGQATSDGDTTPASQVDRLQQPLGASGDGSNNIKDDAEYERMILEGQPFLCRIPKAKKAADAGGANETLTKAEEEKELTRANERGWELLSGMQGNCVFFISGWWSYRFCYNQGVKQFHQLPPSRGVPVYPPIEDPGVPGYMLGTYEKRLDGEDGGKDRDWEGESALELSEGAKRRHSKHGELVQRGESRYLVQKLGGGTICDLTGKERRIEVQFHCSPQATDRISMIKETSTCAYLMVIQTPRLCNDVAFLPPQKDQPNAITCSPILREDEIEDYERDLEEVKEAERETAMWKAEADAMGGDEGFQPSLLPVGDIFVGEHRLVPEGVKIEKSVIVGGGRETYIDTVASSDGKVAGKEELEKLGLADTKAIEKLRKELEKIAQGQNWKLDVIDTPHGREYRGVIGDDDAEQDESAAGAKGEREGGGKESGGKESGKGSGGKESGSKKAEGSKGGKGSTEGLSQDGHESKKGKGEKETEIRKGKAVKPGKGDGRDAEKGESGQEEKEGKQQQQQGSEEEYYKEEL